MPGAAVPSLLCPLVGVSEAPQLRGVSLAAVHHYSCYFVLFIYCSGFLLTT